MTKGMGVKPAVPTKSREEMRSELNLNGSFVMCFVGELSKRKNQKFLIQALNHIREDIDNVSLLLVGDGDEMESLSALASEIGIADAVKFLGRRSDVANILSASDLYVSAAQIEGLPFNIAEALSVGLTVIASDIKGHRDILKGSEAGMLFDPGNVNEFKNLVVKFKNEGLKPNEDKIREAFINFSFDKVFKETLKTITEALNL